MQPNAESTRHSAPQAPADFARYIDHTLLKATASASEIETLCREALEHGFYAVCVNGVHVTAANRILNGVKSKRDTLVAIAAVVGFPLGATTSAAKVCETQQAIREGASEIDMVMRIDLAKTAEWKALRDDIAAVVRAAEETSGGRSVIKVILETSLLSNEEIAASCRAADEAGAHFVKTCTGFSTAGLPPGAATVEHVRLMRASVSSAKQVKASGGIRDFKGARALIEAGATRLGTSSGVALVSSSAVTSEY